VCKPEAETETIVPDKCCTQSTVIDIYIQLYQNQEQSELCLVIKQAEHKLKDSTLHNTPKQTYSLKDCLLQYQKAF
jgi:hypothetical protein